MEIGYKEQVETIKLRLSDVEDLVRKDPKVIEKVLIMFILDPSYDRSAICLAEKEWKKDHNIV